MCIFRGIKNKVNSYFTKKRTIKELEYDILIHESWAGIVTQYPGLYDETMGDYDWHMKWIRVYESAIYYLNGGD